MIFESKQNFVLISEENYKYKFETMLNRMNDLEKDIEDLHNRIDCLENK